MNITVVGGGNIGTQFAVHSAGKGHSVKTFTSNPNRFSKSLFLVDKSDNILKEGEINCIVECTPKLGSILMETAMRLHRGEPVERVIHPEEQVFTDEDDLSRLAPRGY